MSLVAARIILLHANDIIQPLLEAAWKLIGMVYPVFA